MAGVSHFRCMQADPRPIGWGNVLRWLPFVAIGLWAALRGFEGLYGQDPHDYLHIAHAWNAWSRGGSLPAGTLHAQLYPLLGGLLGRLVGDLMALRLITAASFVGVVLIAARQLEGMAADQQLARAYLLVAVAASPFLLRHSLFVMSDVPCLLLIMVAYRQAVRFRADGRSRRTWGVALAAGGALAMRPAAAPMLAVIGTYILVAIIHQRAWRAALAGLLGKAMLAGVVVLLLGRMEVGGWAHPWLTGWSPLHFVRRDFSTLDGHAHYALPNIINVLKPLVHPGFLTIGVVLLPFFRRVDLKRPGAGMAAAMFAAYALFLAGMPFQNDRFLLPLELLAALVLFPAFERAAQRLSPKMLTWGIALVVIGQVVMGAISLRSFVRMARTERELAAWVRSTEGRPVYEFSMKPALGTYAEEVPVVDLWEEQVPHFAPGSLLLFNEGAFADQWQGMAPMMNWERARDQHPQLIARRPDGWALYRFP